MESKTHSQLMMIYLFNNKSYPLVHRFENTRTRPTNPTAGSWRDTQLCTKRSSASSFPNSAEREVRNAKHDRSLKLLVTSKEMLALEVLGLLKVFSLEKEQKRHSDKKQMLKMMSKGFGNMWWQSSQINRLTFSQSCSIEKHWALWHFWGFLDLIWISF